LRDSRAKKKGRDVFVINRRVALACVFVLFFSNSQNVSIESGVGPVAEEDLLAVVQAEAHPSPRRQGLKKKKKKILPS
jgi:hypothetical protein